jgi:hypothetical protein
VAVKIVLPVLAGLMVGCSSIYNASAWEVPDERQQQWDRDAYDCEQEATVAGRVPPPHDPLFKDCMIALGWVNR